MNDNCADVTSKGSVVSFPSQYFNLRNVLPVGLQYCRLRTFLLRFSVPALLPHSYGEIYMDLWKRHEA
jgi:hypothetical protein